MNLTEMSEPTTLAVIAICLLLFFGTTLLPRRPRETSLIILSCIVLGILTTPIYIVFLVAISLLFFIIVNKMPPSMTRTSLLVLIHITFLATPWIIMKEIVPDMSGGIKWLVASSVAFGWLKLHQYAYDRRHREMPAGNLRLFLLFMVFAPVFFVGPVAKFQDFLKGAETDRLRLGRSEWGKSARFLADGIVKLVLSLLIALRFKPDLTRLYVEGAQISVIDMWFTGMLSFLMIFFALSGYSSFVLSITRLLGYPVMRNFNYPFLSRNMITFWSRWHISFSAWLRDYIYIPLGGSRSGNQMFNVITTFLFCGLWHFAYEVLMNTYGWGSLSWMWGFLALGLSVGLTHVYLRMRGKSKHDVPESENPALVGIRAISLFLFLSMIVVLVLCPGTESPVASLKILGRMLLLDKML